MILPLLIGCGQYLEADQALNSSTAAGIDLPDRSELAAATTLLHYSQSALLAAHTSEEEVDIEYISGESTTAALRLVEYSEIIDSIEAQVVLADALANLAAVDPSALASHNEQLAFWLNLYNLWVVQGVVDSLINTPDWDGASTDSFALFTTAYAQVDGYELTFNQLEHGIIRGNDYAWKNYFTDQPELLAAAQAWHASLWEGVPFDARIHVGLNCASRSCPDQPSGAFRAATLDEDLDALAAAFVNNDARGAGPDGISQLFSWYGGDFETTFGSPASFIETYRDGGLSGVDMDTYLNYDWRLNGR